MSIEIQVIKPPRDYASCLKIRSEVFILEQNVPIVEELDGLDDESIHFLVLVDQIPMATARVRIELNFYKIERVAVLKKARGKRLGQKLMDAIELHNQKSYPEYLLYLSSQKEAIPFYQKLGYQTIGKYYLDANIEHKVMIKPPKDVSTLKCLNDPNCREEIKEILERR